jgi:hypothetical protein
MHVCMYTYIHDVLAQNTQQHVHLLLILMLAAAAAPDTYGSEFHFIIGGKCEGSCCLCQVRELQLQCGVWKVGYAAAAVAAAAAAAAAAAPVPAPAAPVPAPAVP